MAAAHYNAGYYRRNGLGLHYSGLPPISPSCPFSISYLQCENSGTLEPIGQVRLGRNEEGGIRCIYHGWKYDVAGNCIDMASVPPHQDFKHKVKAKAYPAVERAGVIWVYMGSSAKAPPLPAFEVLDVPDDEISVTFIQRECNYLQALEGEIDTSHFGFLHAAHVDPDDVPEDDPV